MGRDLEDIIAETLKKTPQAIERVGADLPAGFPEKLFESITKELQKSARLLEAMPLSLSLPMNLDGVPIRGDKVGFFFDKPT